MKKVWLKKKILVPRQPKLTETSRGGTISCATTKALLPLQPLRNKSEGWQVFPIPDLPLFGNLFKSLIYHPPSYIYLLTHIFYVYVSVIIHLTIYPDLNSLLFSSNSSYFFIIPILLFSFIACLLVAFSWFLYSFMVV